MMMLEVGQLLLGKSGAAEDTFGKVPTLSTPRSIKFSSGRGVTSGAINV